MLIRSLKVTARWLSPSILGQLDDFPERKQCLGRNIYRDAVAQMNFTTQKAEGCHWLLKDLLIDVERFVICGPWEMATTKKTANIFLSWCSVMQLNSSQLTWNADEHPFVWQSRGYAWDSGTLWPSLSSTEHAGPRFVDPGGRSLCWIVTAQWSNFLILLRDMDWCEKSIIC